MTTTSQLDLLNIHPAETERPLQYGDRVTGQEHKTGRQITGYICEFGRKYLILSDVPRCGWFTNDGSDDKLPYRVILFATAHRSAEQLHLEISQ